tara:strand:+ start:173 stop:682 length:510 start_codon:yes stop_codon:yes gene_type:complete
MSTNLQFIKSASATSVSSLQITDCFNTNYDVYQVVLDNDNSGNNDLYIRVINNSGTVISTGSKYDYANLEMNSNTSFGENKNTDFNEFRGIGFQALYGASTVATFYNPYNSSSYTFVTSQTASYYNSGQMRGGKSIGVYHNADTITGLEINEVSSDFTYINVSVYGVKG